MKTQSKLFQVSNSNKKMTLLNFENGQFWPSYLIPTENTYDLFIPGKYNGLLLGDSGYPCKSYLMTPYAIPDSPAQERFNKSHGRTRVLIEQTFGILKRRFSCLHSGLRTYPNTACNITMACATLHDIGIDRNDILDIDDDFENVGDINVNVRDDWSGANVRDYVCRSFFQR